MNVALPSSALSSAASSSLLSLQLLEAFLARAKRVIQESMSLRYKPASELLPLVKPHLNFFTPHLRTETQLAAISVFVPEFCGKTQEFSGKFQASFLRNLYHRNR